MFVVAIPQKKVRGGLSGLLKVWRRRSDAVQLYRQDGISFYTVTITTRKGKPDYHELYALAPRFSGRLLMAEGLDPPAEHTELLFSPQRLSEQIMLNVTAKISEMLPLPLIRRSIGLVDEDGIYGDFAEKLIKHSPTVKVFTQNFEYYGQVQEKLLALYGAPLVVTGQFSSLGDCQVIYSPVLQAVEKAAALGPITVSGGVYEGSLRGNVFTLHSLNLTQEMIQLVPQGVNPIYFFGAAYALCGKKELQALKPQTLLIGRRAVAFSSLNGCIQTLYKAPGILG